MVLQCSTTQSRCCPRSPWQSCPHPRCPGREVFETEGFELARLTPGEGRWEVWEVGGQALLLPFLLLFPGEQGAVSSFLLSDVNLAPTFISPRGSKAIKLVGLRLWQVAR